MPYHLWLKCQNEELCAQPYSLQSLPCAVSITCYLAVHATVRWSEKAYLVESDEGFIWPWLFSSQTLFANSFPIEDITLMSSIGQSSRSRERTRERCVPRFRCIPEHSMHMRAPRFKLAQSGSKGKGRKAIRSTGKGRKAIRTTKHLTKPSS